MMPKLRSRARRRMTLIAAIPCKEGFVLAADSQETVPVWSDDQNDYVEYRRTVQKIEPREMGPFSVIVAGSGHAALIDSFIVLLERKLSSAAKDNLTDFVRYTEEALADFYARDFTLCTDLDKDIRLFFSAVPKKGGECGVWILKNVRLEPLAKADLIGFRESLYVNLMDRFSRPNMALQQGILASIYVLTVAEKTSNYVRGPMTVATVKANGIWMAKADYVAAMAERLRVYEEHINNVFLACADTSIHAYQLEEMLSGFSRSAVELHRKHIDDVVGAITIQDMMTMNDPVPRLPPGSVITFGDRGFEFEHDPARLQERNDRFRDMMEQARSAAERMQPSESSQPVDPKPSDSQKSEDQR